MPEWPDMHRRLMEQIIEHERSMGGAAQSFVERFLALLKREGYTLGPKAKAALRAYLEGITPAIRSAIESAVGIVAGAVLTGAARDAFIAQATADAFTRRWADGLQLSQRLWRWQDATRQGIEAVLRDGVRSGVSVNRLVLEMQRAAEAATAERFAIVSSDGARWVDDLADAARSVIRTPAARQEWLKTLERTKEYIRRLSEEGTAHGARQLVSQVEKAVAKGQEELLDSAVKWRAYDKQGYNLRRIARQEMSMANYRATLEATKGNDLIIGYMWRKSRTHSVRDVCDDFSEIDFNLGKGIWPKDRLPKARPHVGCLCKCIPVTRKINEEGTLDSETVMNRIPEDQKAWLFGI